MDIKPPILLLIFVVLLGAVVTNIWAASTTWVPFQLNNGHIIIPAIVNGLEGEAMLDSGATGNMISTSVVEHFGEGLSKVGTVQVRGVFGVQELDRISRVPVEMFGEEFHIKNLIAGHLGGPELLLGLGFFDKFVVQLDYPNQRMRLHDRKSLDLKKYANVPLSREKSSNLPVVKVMLDNEKEVWLIFDTGNSGGLMLSRKFVEQYDWLERSGSDISYSSGVNVKNAQTESFFMADFKIGPYEMENVRVSIPGEGQSSLLGRKRGAGQRGVKRGKNSVGLLGYDVLKHFVVSIDFRNNLLHLGLPEE